MCRVRGRCRAPQPPPSVREAGCFRPRRSPALDPASRRLKRGGLRPPSERVDVDHGELVWRGLDDISIVMRLDEIGPRRGRPAGGCERGRFEWLADRLENLPDGRRVGDEGDEADVAAAGRALQWKLLADAGEEFGPGNSRGVVGAGRLRKGARIPCTLTPALSRRERGRGSVADRERGHGSP